MGVCGWGKGGAWVCRRGEGRGVWGGGVGVTWSGGGQETVSVTADEIGERDCETPSWETEMWTVIDRVSEWVE